MADKADRTVVLLSGGQDSTTAFYAALQEESVEVVAALSFDYGQRHRIELSLAHETANKASVPWVCLPVPALRLMSLSSLTSPEISNSGKDVEGNRFAAERGLPASFTPGRNLLFFSMAAGVAAQYDAPMVVSGVCQQDDAGYPDCRAGFIDSMLETIQQGFAWPEFQLVSPLLRMTKAEIWSYAEELGVLDLIIEETNSCYEGDREHNWVWGYGCGECGACIERAKGFNEFRPAGINVE